MEAENMNFFRILWDELAGHHSRRDGV